MKQIFLGPWVHWLILAVLIGAGWLGGVDKLHVTTFNPFLIILTVVTVIVVLLMLATSKPGERVTRDPVEDDD